jgi:hypothetical protein
MDQIELTHVLYGKATVPLALSDFGGPLLDWI